jgi:peroxiredoxin
MARSLRTLAPVVALLALAAVARPAQAGGKDLTGQPAPELVLTGGLNGVGAATNLASYRGQVVCLKFWLTHCPKCRGTLPDFQAIHDRYGRSGVVCLGVVIDSPAGVTPYVKDKGWTFGVGCDPDAANATKYGVKSYPADYVIGADGVVRASNGFPRETIEEELRKARVAELGELPGSLRAVRDAVEEGNYGVALRLAEQAAKAEGAGQDVKAAAEKVLAIATRRQDNRFARADALVAAGRGADAKALLEDILKDFQGTSLEAKASARLAALAK